MNDYETLTRNVSATASGIGGIIGYINQIVVSKEVIVAEEIRIVLTQTIDNNYSELTPLLTEDRSERLKEAKENASIENTQIMPFTLPFNDGDVRGEAVFAFGVALIVDVLSALIAWALIRRRESSLYYKTIGEYKRSREEMLEDCLVYISLGTIQENQSNNTGVKLSKGEIENEVIEIINKTMKSFMAKIKPLYLPGELNAFGYIDDISGFDENEKLLFYTLNNAVLIHPCHKDEIIKVIRKDFDMHENSKDEGTVNDNKDSATGIVAGYESKFEDGNIYYLVSKNLHVWFCENFSELLQNEMLFSVKYEDDISVVSESET
jgi:hypothetical protein